MAPGLRTDTARLPDAGVAWTVGTPQRQRQRRLVLPEKAVNPFGELLQRHPVVAGELPRQEVVVEEVDRDTSVAPEARAYPVPAPPEDGMPVRKAVDPAVEQNAPPHRFAETALFPFAHEIAQQVAEHLFVVVAGEEEMCKKVHRFLSVWYERTF